jgi:hypothetical protein
VHIHYGFRAQFWQFLAVAECLGVARRDDDHRGDGTSGASAILDDPGVERWLRDLSTEKLLDFFHDLPDGSIDVGSGFMWLHGIDSRRALLAKLAALQLHDFSVDGLRRLGERTAGLLDLHPGLVNLRVVSMAGEVVAELQVDWMMTVAEIEVQLRRRLDNPEAELRLTFGNEVLDSNCSLKGAGAAGKGSAMIVGLVRQPGNLCRYRHPAAQALVGKDGALLARSFFRCAVGECDPGW